MKQREKAQRSTSQSVISRILHHPLLEDRLRGCSNILQALCYTALDHPIYTGTVVGIAGALANNEEHGTLDEAFFATGYLSYLGLKIIRDYMISPQHREQASLSVHPSLEEKVAKAPLNHASLVALGWGVIATMESFEKPEFRVYLQQVIDSEHSRGTGFFIRDYVFQYLALQAAVVDGSLTATRHAINLMHGRRAQKKPSSRLQRWWNFTFEHPLSVGLLTAGYALADDRLPPYPTETEELRNLLLWYGTGTAATLAAGSLLHTDSMRYLGNAALSKWQSMRGHYQQAIERWKKAMAASTAVVTRIEDGIHLADLYSRAGQLEEALAAWRSILPLFDVTDEKRGPLDVLRSVFTGRSATRWFSPFNIVEQATTSSTNTLFVYRNSRLARKRALAKTYNEEGLAKKIFAVAETARRVTAPHVRFNSPFVETPVGIIGGNTLITLRSKHFDMSVGSKLRGSYQKELPEEGKKFAHYVASNLVWFQIEMSKRVITRKNEKGDLEHALDCFGTIVPLQVMDYERKIRDRAFLGKETDRYHRLMVPSPDKDTQELYQAIEDRVLQHVAGLQQHSDCLLHGDLTARNVLLNGILIDLEKVCIGHPFVDLAFLAVDLNSYQTEGELLYEYCAETPRELRHRISPPRAYDEARLYASLEPAGSASDRAEQTEARQFLIWAREALEDLGDKETPNALGYYLLATGRKSLV